MQPLWGNAAVFAVALIFYIWKTYATLLLRRQRVLRERVAYMLWMTADHVDGYRTPRGSGCYPVSCN